MELTSSFKRGRLLKSKYLWAPHLRKRRSRSQADVSNTLQIKFKKQVFVLYFFVFVVEIPVYDMISLADSLTNAREGYTLQSVNSSRFKRGLAHMKFYHREYIFVICWFFF